MNQKPSRVTESVNELLHVDRLVAGGLGFGRRTSGEPVFARGAVPGDTLELHGLQKHHNYSRAEHFRVLTPGPGRRTPPCEYQSRCGGCDLMTLEESAQRAAKHGMVLDILARTAKTDASATSAVPLTWRDPRGAAALGYRSRVRLHIGARGQLGFRAEQSHDLVDVSRCLVANPVVNQVLARLRHGATLNPRLFAAFGQIEIRALGEQPDLLWIAHPLAQEGRPRRHSAHKAAKGRSPASPPTPTSSSPNDALQSLRRSLENLVPESAHWLMGARLEEDAWRANAQSVDLSVAPGCTPARLLFAPGMFTQVNWQINRAIVEDVLMHVTRYECQSFLDLYCGAGNFSLPLLAQGLEGVGVETNALSISAARTASTHQGLGGRFVAGDVPATLRRLLEQGASYDVVLLDPPRAGFKEAAAYVPRVARKAVFVCACDPTTFARDLRSLLDQGLLLESLTAYDMFPQTHHLELTAWLRPGAEGVVSDRDAQAPPHPPDTSES